MATTKAYWDSSCFISFISGIHPEEKQRADICEDVIKHARNRDIEIWTSAWTIVETIRPKEQFSPRPLPAWAVALDAKDAHGNLIWPRANAHLQTIWDYHERNTVPTRMLPPSEATKIKLMFTWPWIKMIQIAPTIADHAADLCRTHRMKAGDSLHVASALARGCDVIHRWDKDFQKTDNLIPSAEPVRISPQGLLGII